MSYKSFHQTNRGMGIYKISLFMFLIVLFCSSLGAQPGRERESLSTGLIQTVKIPQLPFIPNNGQINDNVAFYAKSSCGTTLITKYGEIVYAIGCKQGGGNDAVTQPSSKVDITSDMAHQSGIDGNQKSNPLQVRSAEAGALKEGFIGGRIRGAKGERETLAKVNYFTGNDPSGWKTNISTFEEVDMGEIYEGISLRLKAHGNTVEKYFSVKPAQTGGDKRKNRRAKALRINKNGRIEAETDAGVVTFSRPFAYQEIDGKKVDVAVDYRIIGDRNRSIQKDGTPLPAIPSSFPFCPLVRQTGPNGLPLPIDTALWSQHITRQRNSLLAPGCLPILEGKAPTPSFRWQLTQAAMYMQPDIRGH